MADEIVHKMTLVLANGGVTDEVALGTIKLDQTTAVRYVDTITVTTSESSISSFGGVTTPGVVVLYNTDPTNFVEYGWSTGDYGPKLFPAGSGIPHTIQLQAGKTMYWKADTGSCKVDIHVWDV